MGLSWVKEFLPKGTFRDMLRIIVADRDISKPKDRQDIGYMFLTSWKINKLMLSPVI
jgi:hypothetical protein